MAPSPSNRVRRIISGAMPAHNPAMQHDTGLDAAMLRVQRSGRQRSHQKGGRDMTASRRKFLKTAAVAGAGGAIAGAPAIVRSQQVTTWRCQTLWSSAELTQRCFEDFCERVKAGSNGRLVIQPFAAGAVTGVFESLDAVTAGV